MQKVFTNVLCYLFILFFLSPSFGQNSKTVKSLVDKGRTLYYLEKASRQGEKILEKEYPQLKPNIGGYFSYIEKGITTCICFSKGNNPKVLLSIFFDDIGNSDEGFSNDDEREFTLQEYELFMIRNYSIRETNNNPDIILHRNTLFHFIPLIENKKKEVYVLTVSVIDTIAVLGNDFLLAFDNKGNCVKTKTFHSNFMPFVFSKTNKNSAEKTLSSHTHTAKQDDFITETDIATLLLYTETVGWKEHYVISEKYVSIWNCETEELRILTMSEWDKLTN